jgi:hypothetical protein
MHDSEQSVITGFFIYTFILSGIWFSIGCIFGARQQAHEFKSEAVVQGLAEYIPDEKGNPVWQWKK